jgi:hypothetical protein
MFMIFFGKFFENRDNKHDIPISSAFGDKYHKRYLSHGIFTNQA